MNHFSYLSKTSELYLFENFEEKIEKLAMFKLFSKIQSFSKFFGSSTN